jgi:hypothetical protein
LLEDRRVPASVHIGTVIGDEFGNLARPSVHVARPGGGLVAQDSERPFVPHRDSTSTKSTAASLTLLDQEIKYLDSQTDRKSRNIAFLLSKAEKRFDDLHLSSEVATASLSPAAGGFVLSSSAVPLYFSEPFQRDSHLKVSANPNFFDYDNAHPASELKEYWVDFSNVHLGGGVFDGGFAQEEVMFLETPELANLAAAAYFAPASAVMTRVSNGTSSPTDEALAGSPYPWIFDGVQRVMSIDTNPPKADGLTRNELVNRTTAELSDHSHPLASAQRFNVLAIAAPYIPKGASGQADNTSLPVIEDLFNTEYAGFSLVKRNSKVANPLVNTGALGAGAFNGSRAAAYVTQYLAADLTGVNIQMWGYTQSAIDQYDSQYVKPILNAYDHAVAINPAAYNHISYLLAVTSEVLSGQTVPPPAPQPQPQPQPIPPFVSQIRILQTHIKLNAKGKPVGNPVVGIQLQYSTTMNGATIANPGNYQIGWFSVRKVKKQPPQNIFHPVRIVTIRDVNPTISAATIVTNAKRATFPKGGQLTILGSAPGQIADSAGTLIGRNLVFRISNNARGIAPA